MEREQAGYEYRAAPGMAITDNGIKDTPVQSQSERDRTVAGNEDSRQRPAGGASPVELIRCQPLDEFPTAVRGVEDKWSRFLIKARWRERSMEAELFIIPPTLIRACCLAST